MSPRKIGDKIQSFSLKGRLFILLLVMLLPFVLFSIYKSLEVDTRLEDDIKAENLKIAKMVAHDVDEYIVSTGEVLIPIAKNKDVRSQNYPAIKEYLEKIVPEYPYYHLIAFVDVDGNVRAAAMSDIMANSEDAKIIQLSVRDTACYRRGIVSNGISVGDFMHSKITGMPVVHVTYPVYDYSGKRVGFIAAAFDLTKIQNKIMQVNADRNTIISVVDDRGVYIARSKEPKRWVGKSIAGADRFKEMLRSSEGTYRTKSSDGTMRIFGYATASKAPWFVRAGVDESVIAVQMRKELVNYFTVFIPFLLVAILGWFWMGRDVDRLHRKTQYLTLVDPLTELWNCRKLDQDFCRELNLSRRHREPLSFAMIDIDHFKNYNDQNGHQMGDEVLRAVASAILRAVRDTDLVYRYGGEEICVILPRTDRDDAALILERIRTGIENTQFPGGDTQPAGKVTVSIGHATYPHDSISKEGLVKSADIALYKAKNNGRNRIEAYNASDPDAGAQDFYPFSHCI